MTVQIEMLFLIHTKGGDQADDDDDEQSESAACDLVECNGSSRMEMRVRVTR